MSCPVLPSEPPTERCSPDASDLQQPRQSSPGHSSFNVDDTLRDIIIGFSDGLTVPFALTAGLSTLGSIKLVIIGGLAELFSGMISMGLGAYLAATTERDRYHSQHEFLLRLNRETSTGNDIYSILETYHVSRTAAAALIEELCANDEQRVRFKMDFRLRMREPERCRAWASGMTMGLSYFIGGLIPMIPYFAMKRVSSALFVSIAVTVVVLLSFGYIKNYVAMRNHRAGVWGAVQTLVIGVIAAGTSYAIVKTLDAGVP